MANRINICSFSGGGVMGYLEAGVVKELDRQTNYLEDVHLFAGTSTGSIIAIALACGYEPQKIMDLFRENAKEIFKYTLLDKFKSLFGFYRSKYSHKGLRRVLENEFGEKKLKDIEKPILISAFDLGNDNEAYKAKYFSNFQNKSYGNLKIVDCLLASCSAPTYFPAYRMMHSIRDIIRQYIDGGVCCNHPAVSAITAAMDINGLNAYADEIACISIGSGLSKRNALGWSKRGAVGWIKSIVGIFMEQYSTVNYQAEKILKPDLRHHENAKGIRYRMINPPLENKIDLDDIKSFHTQDKALKNAQALITSGAMWINNYDWGRKR